MQRNIYPFMHSHLRKVLIYIFGGLFCLGFATIIFLQWYKTDIQDTIPGAMLSVYLDKDFNLSPRQPAQYGDYRIEFENIINDSRCPEGVQCFTAGDVSLEVHIVTPTAELRSEMSLVGNPVFSFDGYKLELISVAPYPKAGETTPTEKYRAGFVLVKGGSVIPR